MLDILKLPKIWVSIEQGTAKSRDLETHICTSACRFSTHLPSLDFDINLSIQRYHSIHGEYPIYAMVPKKVLNRIDIDVLND